MQQEVLKALGEIWPHTTGDVVAGYGFCLPYLGLFKGEAERVIALMPGPQGACQWPTHKKNLATLVQETQLPLRDQSVDRLIILHAFEYSDNIQALLEESWRILREGGDLLIIVPNRRSVWSQVSSTPLGYGTPYTAQQLGHIVTQTGFSPLDPSYCLYTPPNERFLTFQLASSLEKYGRLFSRKWGGILLLPVKKQMYAPKTRSISLWTPGVFKPRVTGGIVRNKPYDGL